MRLIQAFEALEHPENEENNFKSQLRSFTVLSRIIFKQRYTPKRS